MKCHALLLAISPRLIVVCACAGLVFFAFALNMVDCGGLLGGRLGADKSPAHILKGAGASHGTVPLHKRTFTL